MKRQLFYIIVLLNMTILCAQQGVNYKAVISDKGEIIQNKQVEIYFTILEEGITNIYSESHIKSTDNNGIVVLSIGEGTSPSADFTKIDWSKEQFLKVEIDAGNGIVNMGTTKFNSVPYAFHAKSAESLIGGIKTYKAGTGISITDYVISKKKYTIGDLVFGGVVFWVDEAGEHGLICSLKNVSDNAIWMEQVVTSVNDVDKVMYTQSNGIGAGKLNTAIILSANVVEKVSNTNYAASLCTRYGYDYLTNLNVIVEIEDWDGSYLYGDWYLPSVYEFSLMYLNKDFLNNIFLANGGQEFDDEYWTSNEETENFGYSIDNYSYAWLYHMNDNQISSYSKNTEFAVRAVRSF